MSLFLLLVLVAVVMGYIRLAPSNPEQWHVTPDVTENRDLAGGVLRVIETGPDGLARLRALALATPRTVELAGSVESGMITFVTRSQVMGFPDYCTAVQDGEQLKIYSRLRFGRSDMGVNKARVDGWIANL